MFYYIFYEKLLHFFSPFNVFHYITFRLIMASLTSLLISLWLGRYDNLGGFFYLKLFMDEIRCVD